MPRPQRLELEYEPPGFKAGMAVTLGALAACLLLMLRRRG